MCVCMCVCVCVCVCISFFMNQVKTEHFIKEIYAKDFPFKYFFFFLRENRRIELVKKQFNDNSIPLSNVATRLFTYTNLILKMLFSC